MEARRDAEALIREGHSVSDVARTLDVDRSTIGRWMAIGGLRLKELARNNWEREEAGEPPLARPDWLQREQYRKASKGALPAEYAERVASAQEALAAAAKERVALLRENGGKLAVPEVDAEAFAKRAVAEAERLMGEGLYDLAERSMRIAERLARVKGLLGAGAGIAGGDARRDAEKAAETDAFEARRRAEQDAVRKRLGIGRPMTPQDLARSLSRTMVARGWLDEDLVDHPDGVRLMRERRAAREAGSEEAGDG